MREFNFLIQILTSSESNNCLLLHRHLIMFLKLQIFFKQAERLKVAKEDQIACPMVDRHNDQYA